MTGTGTQTDPFYPTNFEEFVTAISTDNAYIECPENGIWNMNEMLPDGITNIIMCKALKINGNGLTIKNLYFNNGKISLNKNNSEILKTNFLNFVTSGNNSYCFDAINPCFMKNCKFSGLISHGYIFNGKITFTHDEEKSCAFNFEFCNNAYLFQTSSVTNQPNFLYCNIHLDGESTADTKSSATNGYQKCYISGKCPWENLTMLGTDNIFDIEIPNNARIYNNSGSNWNTNVINSDKLHGDYTFPTANSNRLYLQATTEQLSDAAYLRSIGFSIAG